MTAIAVFPVLVCVVGLLVWFLSSHPKVSEAGRLAFGAGLLVTCVSLAAHVVRLG